MKKRIYLRRFEYDDIGFINGIVSETNIFSLTGANSIYSSKTQNQKFLENAIDNAEPLYLVICLSDEDLPIGYLSLRDFDRINRKVHWSGIMISNKHSGHGYATEAGSLIINYVFNELNMHKIYGRVMENNIPSLRMCEKLGFTQEGTLRDEVYKYGKYHNVIIIGLLDSEWKDRESND